MNAKLLLLSTLIQFGGSYPVAGFPLLYQVGKTYRYVYSTETMFNEATSPKTTAAQKDVGFKFSAIVEFTPVWAAGQDILIKLAITKPRLHSIARSNLAKDLKSLPRLPIFFQWEGGKVGRVYASEDDSTLAINIKKGIISIFQLKLEDGKHEEVDASGECVVSYSKSGDIIKRTKTGCMNIETTGQFSTVHPLLGISKESTSKTTYHLSDDIIKSATCLEQHTARLNIETSVAYMVSVRQDLKLENISGSKGIEGNNLDDVIKKISKKQKLNLYGMILGTSFEPTPCVADSLALADKVSKHRQNMLASNSATTDATGSFLQMVESLRSASKDSVLGILKDKENEDVLGPLIDAAVAAQTSACQAALMEHLKFDDSYYIDTPERYLLAVAFSTHPTETLLSDLFKLYSQDIPSEKLHESIGETLGAVLYTYCRVGQQCQSKLAKGILDTFLTRLETCVKDDCKPMVIRALANAGIAHTIPVLLKYAETANDSRINEAAIKAFRRMGADNINEEVKNTMRRIFHQNNRGYDTAVRSQALKILLGHNPTQKDITNIVLETTDPYNTDFDLYVQAQLFDLLERDIHVRSMVKEALKDPEVNNWNIMAPKGKALAFTNKMAETSGMTSTYFMYMETSRAGIMKRTGMDVLSWSPVQNISIYSFGMFAAGLEGLLGEEVEEGQEGMSVTSGMSLDLVDVSLRPITFFTGQSGLMSALWSAPSEPVSALQTNILLTDHLERIHLQNGLIVELNIQAALSMDLSGSLSVSLWNKNSKSLVQNSGAVTIKGSASITSSPFKTGVEISTQTATVLDFKTDVDFYDGVKMCLQMSRPDFTVRQNVTKYEHARGFPKGYVSRIRRSQKINALSYPLPKSNAKKCRIMLGDS